MLSLKDIIPQYGGNTDMVFILFPPVWPHLPPLGFLTLSEYLEKHGFTCGIIDLNLFCYDRLKAKWGDRWTIIHGPEKANFQNDLNFIINMVSNELDHIITQLDPAYLGFSLFGLNKKTTMEWIEILKKKHPQRRFVVGGPEVLYEYWRDPDFYKKWPHVDRTIAGEGEFSLLKVLKKEISSPFIYEKSRDFPRAFPRPSLVKTMFYPRKRAFPVMFTRGCVNRCSFCAECRLFHFFKQEDPDAFTDYLKELQEKGIHWVTFFDSLINGNFARLEKLCLNMIKKGVKLWWDAQIHIQPQMPLTLLKLMKKAGCFHGFVGLESGNDAILNRMKKKYNAEEARLFFKKMKQSELFFEVSMIVGYPGETKKEFNDTIRFIEENSPYIKKIAQINPFIPLPGTPDSNKTSEDKKKSAKKIKKILQVAKRNKILYTDSYIGNL